MPKTSPELCNRIRCELINPMEYKKWSYEQLSTEFKLFLSRAIQFIPLMYNRLTLVDKLSHKSAITRIYNDHRHLTGFSQRNIRRNLPLYNEVVPRRVRPSCPKSSLTDIKVGEESSNTKQSNPSLEEQLVENAKLRLIISFLEVKIKCLEELLANEWPIQSMNQLLFSR